MSIYHVHHITPKYLLKHKPKSFVDDPRNKAKVTIPAHIALHKWLYMLLGNLQDLHAMNKLKGSKDLYGENAPNYGHTHTQSAKDQISKSLDRFWSNPSNKKKHYEKLLKGKDHPRSQQYFIHGKVFGSSYEAGCYFHVSDGTIRSWVKENMPLCYTSKNGVVVRYKRKWNNTKTIFMMNGKRFGSIKEIIDHHSNQMKRGFIFRLFREHHPLCYKVKLSTLHP